MKTGHSWSFFLWLFLDKEKKDKRKVRIEKRKFYFKKGSRAEMARHSSYNYVLKGALTFRAYFQGWVQSLL